VGEEVERRLRNADVRFDTNDGDLGGLAGGEVLADFGDEAGEGGSVGWWWKISVDWVVEGGQAYLSASTTAFDMSNSLTVSPNRARFWVDA
jgi:hypothetical protein